MKKRRGRFVSAIGALAMAALALGADARATVFTNAGGSGSALNAWAAAEQTAILAAAPALTACQYSKAGLVHAAPVSSPFIAGTIEGGSIGVNSSTLWGRHVAGAYQTPKSKSWGVSYHGKFSAITAGNDQFIGLINAAATHGTFFGWAQAIDATHWILQATGSATTTVSSATAEDALAHTFRFTFDGTTEKVAIDGTTVVTNATLTNLLDEQMDIGSFAVAATSPGVVISEIEYCYVSPF